MAMRRYPPIRNHVNATQLTMLSTISAPEAANFIWKIRSIRLKSPHEFVPPCILSIHTVSTRMQSAHPSSIRWNKFRFKNQNHPVGALGCSSQCTS